MAANALEQGGAPAHRPGARLIGPSKLVATVIQEIDALIARGVLVPGQRLVEADLMQRLGVGRMPVREALRILAGDGVVELTPNSSARIRSLDPLRLVQMQAVFQALYETAMRLFIANGPPAEGVSALRAAREQINAVRHGGSAQAILHAILDFHHVTVEFSGNDYLSETIARLHVPLFQRDLADAIGLPALFRVSGIYTNLTDHIVDGDLAAAVAAMAPHLARFKHLLLAKAKRQRTVAPA